MSSKSTKLADELGQAIDRASTNSTKKVTIKNGFYIWNKGENLTLTEWFDTGEFDCNCTNKSCVVQTISVELVDKLTKIRNELKLPININSGFRCQARQEEIRRNRKSSVVAPGNTSNHLKGEAADVKVGELAGKDWLNVASKYFTSIGVGSNFLHIDTRKIKARWNY